MDSSALVGTLEIRAARLRRLDPQLEKLAGQAFVKAAKDPLALEVETAKPLPRTARTTSAVIIWNEETLTDTWSVLPNRLVAFFPDRTRIKDVNLVAAAWIGSEATSRSRKPLEVRATTIGQ